MKKIIFGTFFVIMSASAKDNFGFNYQSEVVNPACVAMFNSSLADHPYLTGINLNVCQHSNAAYQSTSHTDEGWHSFYHNNKDDKDGNYSYKVIGKTQNGIYIIHTLDSGGGTMIASDLLLVQLRKNNQFVYNGPTLKTNGISEMRLLGYIQGGDRCVGDFAKVEIMGNTLKIKQYNDESPAGECKKTRQYTVDLSKLTS